MWKSCFDLSLVPNALMRGLYDLCWGLLLWASYMSLSVNILDVLVLRLWTKLLSSTSHARPAISAIPSIPSNGRYGSSLVGLAHTTWNRSGARPIVFCEQLQFWGGLSVRRVGIGKGVVVGLARLHWVDQLDSSWQKTILKIWVRFRAWSLCLGRFQIGGCWDWYMFRVIFGHSQGFQWSFLFLRCCPNFRRPINFLESLRLVLPLLFELLQTCLRL